MRSTPGEPPAALADVPVDSVMQLPPGADAPALARQFVLDHRDHLPRDVVDDAQLLVSELVTNAVRHGRTTITLRVRSAPPGIGVAVADDGDTFAESQPTLPAADATDGRGLAIVAALSTAWGVDDTVPPPGKTVWFELTAS